MHNRGFRVSSVLILGLFLNAAIQSADTLSTRDAQEALKAKGYFNGAVDGKYGPQTRSAITKYQKEQGLPVTGRLDAATSGRLTSAPTTEAAGTIAGAAKETTSAATSTGKDGVRAAANEAASSSKSTTKSAWGEMKGALGGGKKSKDKTK